MTDIKSTAQKLSPDAEARNVKSIAGKTGNIYASLAIISRRANQISVDLKKELHAKLEEFAVTSETLEEIHENKEQIEISKFYERLPNPAIIAYTEFMDGKLEHRHRNEDDSDASEDV